jgi:hypothetical protein
MAIDPLPNSPSEFNTDSARNKINELIGSNSSVTVSDSPPTSPAEGDLWFDQGVANLYVYVNTPTNAWVQADSFTLPSGEPSEATVPLVPLGSVAMLSISGMTFSVSMNPNGSDYPPYPYHQGVSPGQAGYHTYQLRASPYPSFMDSYYQGMGQDGLQDHSLWDDQRWHYSQQTYSTGNSIWTGTNYSLNGWQKGPAGAFYGGAGNPWTNALYAGGPISANQYPNPYPPFHNFSGMESHQSKFTSASGERLLISSSSVNIPPMEVGATITASKNILGGGSFPRFYLGSWYAPQVNKTDPGWNANAWVICRIA